MVGPTWPLTKKTFVAKFAALASATALVQREDCPLVAIVCRVCRLWPEMKKIFSTIELYSCGR
jgi:hypothetical protein